MHSDMSGSVEVLQPGMLPGNDCPRPGRRCMQSGMH